MTYVPHPRDFEAPRNEYAALRAGVVLKVRNAPAAASDVHRHAARFVSSAIVATAILAALLLLPSAINALDVMTSMFDAITPAVQ